MDADHPERAFLPLEHSRLKVLANLSEISGKFFEPDVEIILQRRTVHARAIIIQLCASFLRIVEKYEMHLVRVVLCQLEPVTVIDILRVRFSARHHPIPRQIEVIEKTKFRTQSRRSHVGEDQSFIVDYRVGSMEKF